MVWIHGGGFYAGSTKQYSSKYIMDRDVVLVTLNYRLGILGFLSTETLDCPGNFGLKDQVTALQWVQQNIAAFGGNPNSVTIFGGSAGGISVAYHLISKKSQGYFHKAIPQSGTYQMYCGQSPKGVPAEKAKRVAEIVGCDVSSGSWSTIVECIRGKPATELAEAIGKFEVWDANPLISFPPVIEPEHDDAFLTFFPNNQEISSSVPIMMGFTADEGLFRSAKVISDPHLLEDIKNKFNNIMPLLLLNDKPLTQEDRDKFTKAIVEFYFKDGLNFNKENFQNLTNVNHLWFPKIEYH